MRLREFLDMQEMPVTAFARKLTVHPNHIFMIISGKRRPSIDLARIIERMTDKKVTVDDLIERKEPLCCPTCGKKMD